MIKIFVPAILLLIAVHANAQQAFTNKGNLQVHTGASIAAFGNFSNSSSGILLNNGIFHIKGNITNDQSSMTAGTGTLHLDGSAAQSLNGSQVFRTYNLNTNNSSGITLNNDLSVTAAHTFTSGIINSSSAPNFLIYENGSSYSGSADNSHVNGWVRKTGASNFIYPVGNSSYLRPIAVIALSASSVFNVNYAGTSTNTGNLAAPLVIIDPTEYWWVNQVSGGTAQIDMNWDNSKVPFPDFPLASIRVGNYTSGAWTQRGGSATGSVATTGSITSSSLGGFGAFTFGSLNFTLPLSFLGITARRQDTYSVVQWKTVEETGVDHFEIERKDNINSTFFRIGSVPANNNPQNVYEIEDRLPLQGTAFYRIRSVDLDGKYEYSKIVSVNAGRNGGAITILNNPARNIIFVSINDLPKGSYAYELMDGTGKSVQTGRMQLEGQSVVNIPLSAKIAKGLYVLKIRNSSFIFADKIIIQ